MRANGVRGVMRGSAITIDLGRDGLVFVVDAPGWPRRPIGKPSAFLSDLPLVLNDLAGNGSKPSVIKNAVMTVKSLPRVPVDVPSWAMPAMGRFRKIEDPSSIELLYAPDLARSLGSGISFESATFELTDEPISEVPKVWPDWLKHGDPASTFVEYEWKGAASRVEPLFDVRYLRLSLLKGY